MGGVIGAILAYLISLAGNERSAAIHKKRKKRLEKAMEDQEALQGALVAGRSLRQELQRVALELARNRARLGVSAQEEPLFALLLDETFQADLGDWLMAGGIPEGCPIKERLAERMEAALVEGGAQPDRIAYLRDHYFEAAERQIFSNPVLAGWRHQLSLDFLREQVAELRRRAEEAAGVYSPEKQKAALDRYCELALKAWDIIDLSNLPEGDVHIATQALLLRQLYVPLRVRVEARAGAQDSEKALADIEDRRDQRRLLEAGRVHRDAFAEPVGPRPDSPEHFPIGERLSDARRLVVLGDPGGGKTTALRWMATAYLLRRSNDPAFDALPDTDSLPAEGWIPVLIRCRDLGHEDLCRSFTDIVAQHLRKSELKPDDAVVMKTVVLDSIARGEALILVDGLDEITDPQVRMKFSQQLERTAARYPEAPIVVTSRIVGYRDMPYHMGAGFEHATIADLTREDKELFARRWVEVTEQHRPPEDRGQRAQDLVNALHSSDRIERLAGNPMLLTTLALVKRKVGKLPSRRIDLYREAISVLLNWNLAIYTEIDEHEAVPQLEYLAFEMCRRGVQSLTEDDVLGLLDGVRQEYPNIRAIRNRASDEFLQLLEARSSMLVRSGGMWREDSSQTPVWEFRHLTFQEYLAARALLDGKYRGRDKTKTLAEQVAPLAGALTKADPAIEEREGLVVSDSWREAIRLCVAGCPDDDVDATLLAVVTPPSGEDAQLTARPRAVLAALCLADEPNVSEETATILLEAFAAQVNRWDASRREARTAVDRAVQEIGHCIWAVALNRCLVAEFRRRAGEERWNPGSLSGKVQAVQCPDDGPTREKWLYGLVERLRSEETEEATGAALATVMLAFTGRVIVVPGLVEALLAMVPGDPATRHAGLWALGWLGNGCPLPRRETPPFWDPGDRELELLLSALEGSVGAELSAFRIILPVLGRSGNGRFLAPIVKCLDHSDDGLRQNAAKALGLLGDPDAAPRLIIRLQDNDENVRMHAAEALGLLGDRRAAGPLTACLGDDSHFVVEKVAEALGRLADPGELVEIMRAPELDPHVRDLILAGLARNPEPGAKEAVHKALRDPDPAARQRLIACIARGRSDLERRLLSRDLDGGPPWLDPLKPIDEERVQTVATELRLSAVEIRGSYEVLSDDLGFTLAWKTET